MGVWDLGWIVQFTSKWWKLTCNLIFVLSRVYETCLWYCFMETLRLKSSCNVKQIWSLMEKIWHLGCACNAVGKVHVKFWCIWGTLVGKFCATHLKVMILLQIFCQISPMARQLFSVICVWFGPFLGMIWSWWSPRVVPSDFWCVCARTVLFMVHVLIGMFYYMYKMYL